MKKAVKIKSIEKINNLSDRYDIEIEDNKNYFANGILVHNTKLSVWRNDEDWNADYTKNWVVAFKNQILYGEEFESTDRDSTKKHSVGISQYAFVHDHLKKVHNKGKSIPKGTEFFIEFIQNKLTTTRDYKNKHGLYLIAHSPASGEVEGGMLKTKPSGFFQDKNDQYSKALSLNLPPVVFEGKLDSVTSITQGIQNPKLKKAWDNNKGDYETDPYMTVKKTFLEFESVLGGKTEGVVLHGKSGKIYKFIQDDQHSPEVRWAKKAKYTLKDKKEQAKYWESINSFSKHVLKEMKYDFNKLEYKEILKKYAETINRLTERELEEFVSILLPLMDE